MAVNAWLLPLVFLSCFAVGGLAYDLRAILGQGRQARRPSPMTPEQMVTAFKVQTAAAQAERDVQMAHIEAERTIALGEIADEARILYGDPDAHDGPTGVIIANPPAGKGPERPVSGSNGHRSKNRGRKRRR